MVDAVAVDPGPPERQAPSTPPDAHAQQQDGSPVVGSPVTVAPSSPLGAAGIEKWAQELTGDWTHQRRKQAEWINAGSTMFEGAIAGLAGHIGVLRDQTVEHDRALAAATAERVSQCQRIDGKADRDELNQLRAQFAEFKDTVNSGLEELWAAQRRDRDELASLRQKATTMEQVDNSLEMQLDQIRNQLAAVVQSGGAVGAAVMLPPPVVDLAPVYGEIAMVGERLAVAEGQLVEQERQLHQALSLLEAEEAADAVITSMGTNALDVIGADRASIEDSSMYNRMVEQSHQITTRKLEQHLSHGDGFGGGSGVNNEEHLAIRAVFSSWMLTVRERRAAKLPLHHTIEEEDLGEFLGVVSNTSELGQLANVAALSLKEKEFDVVEQLQSPHSVHNLVPHQPPHGSTSPAHLQPGGGAAASASAVGAQAGSPAAQAPAQARAPINMQPQQSQIAAVRKVMELEQRWNEMEQSKQEMMAGIGQQKEALQQQLDQAQHTESSQIDSMQRAQLAPAAAPPAAHLAARAQSPAAGQAREKKLKSHLEGKVAAKMEQKMEQLKLRQDLDNLIDSFQANFVPVKVTVEDDHVALLALQAELAKLVGMLSGLDEDAKAAALAAQAALDAASKNQAAPVQEPVDPRDPEAERKLAEMQRSLAKLGSDFSTQAGQWKDEQADLLSKIGKNVVNIDDIKRRVQLELPQKADEGMLHKLQLQQEQMLKQIRDGLSAQGLAPEIEQALLELANMKDMKGLLQEQGMKIAELFVSKAGSESVAEATHMVHELDTKIASQLDEQLRQTHQDFEETRATWQRNLMGVSSAMNQKADQVWLSQLEANIRAQMEELARNGSSSITKKELDRKLAELRAKLGELGSMSGMTETGSAMFRCICCDRPLPAQEKWSSYEKNNRVAGPNEEGRLNGPDQHEVIYRSGFPLPNPRVKPAERKLDHSRAFGKYTIRPTTSSTGSSPTASPRRGADRPATSFHLDPLAAPPSPDGAYAAEFKGGTPRQNSRAFSPDAPEMGRIQSLSRSSRSGRATASPTSGQRGSTGKARGKQNFGKWPQSSTTATNAQMQARLERPRTMPALEPLVGVGRQSM